MECDFFPSKLFGCERFHFDWLLIASITIRDAFFHWPILVEHSVVFVSFLASKNLLVGLTVLSAIWVWNAIHLYVSHKILNRSTNKANQKSQIIQCIQAHGRNVFAHWSILMWFQERMEKKNPIHCKQLHNNTSVEKWNRLNSHYRLWCIKLYSVRAQCMDFLFFFKIELCQELHFNKIIVEWWCICVHMNNVVREVNQLLYNFRIALLN